jgi:hypothetical protein
MSLYTAFVFVIGAFNSQYFKIEICFFFREVLTLILRRPGFAYGQHVGFVVDKAALGQVFSEYFGFPCQTFHRFLHYHNHPGLTQ